MAVSTAFPASLRREASREKPEGVSRPHSIRPIRSVPETPLAQWAKKADNWDGIDPIPAEDEPVFYTD